MRTLYYNAGRKTFPALRGELYAMTRVAFTHKAVYYWTHGVLTVQATLGFEKVLLTPMTWTFDSHVDFGMPVTILYMRGKFFSQSFTLKVSYFRLTRHHTQILLYFCMTHTLSL